MPYAGSDRSRTATGGIRPDEVHPPADNRADRSPGVSRRDESPRRGTSADLAAGPAPAMATASAFSWNGVCKAEVGMAVPQLAPEMEELGGDARSGLAAAAPGPRLGVGVELLGEYRGSGLTQATYLVRRAGGQLVHVSRLLYLVLSQIDAR